MTGLIHEYSDAFDAALAIGNMRAGKRWPRAEYLVSELDFKLMISFLKCTEFKFQADIVHLAQCDSPDLDELCRLVALSREELTSMGVWDEPRSSKTPYLSLDSLIKAKTPYFSKQNPLIKALTPYLK